MSTSDTTPPLQHPDGGVKKRRDGRRLSSPSREVVLLQKCRDYWESASQFFNSFVNKQAEELKNMPENKRRIRRQIFDYVVLWQSSLRFRVVSFISIATMCAMIATGVGVAFTLRSQIFDRTLAECIDRYDLTYMSASDLFTQTDISTAEGLQTLAEQVVSIQYDSSASVIGLTFIPYGSQTLNDKPIEPVTPFTIPIHSLVSPQVRAQVQETGEPRWVRVRLSDVGEEDSSAIIIGRRLHIPESGDYEFYVAYSISDQEDTVYTVIVVLALGFLVLLIASVAIVYIVVRFVLEPIRQASANARRIADGKYHVRMDVKGKDELAQLARSFNAMATSIEEQIERYERVSKVQQNFVSAVSHELRSPVTTIRMAGQLIYDKRAELPPALRRSAELQYDQLIDLDAMLSDLLEISRFDAGEMVFLTEASDIAAIVEKVVRAQQPLAEDNGVHISVNISGTTIANVEPRRIERIIRNLVVNGLEHAEGRLLKIQVIGTDTAVAVEVSDHGIGLDEEQVTHVFDRFWRADSSRVRKSGGSGLGLTIAYEDAQLHGGTLECAGELGVGATFLLTLPREPGVAYEKPLPLRVAAAEEEWEDVTEAGSALHIENIQDEEDVFGISSTQEIPAIRIGVNPKGCNIKVDVPSLGVAIIEPADEDTEEENHSNNVQVEDVSDEKRDEDSPADNEETNVPVLGKQNLSDALDVLAFLEIEDTDRG